MKKMRRRTFLKSLGLTTVAAGLVGCSSKQKHRSVSVEKTLLRANFGRQQLDNQLPDQTAVWRFNQSVPGPLLRTKQGMSLHAELINELAEGTAIHWHGIRIDNAMDGVVGITQPEVLPGETFNYQFATPDAGTYWYHAHQRSYEQVGRGLYGVLIVDEPVNTDIDLDVVVSIDDWRLQEDAQISTFKNNMHDIAHAGRTGAWLTVNGKGFEEFQFGSGERIRLRLLNTANSLVMNLRLPRWPIWVMALDGMPIRPEKLDNRILQLAPGQRVDVFMDCPINSNEVGMLSFVERGDDISLATFHLNGGSTRSVRDYPPSPLPENSINIGRTSVEEKHVALRIEGGARGKMQHAIYNGRQMGIKELVFNGKAWSLNGVAGLTDQPLFRSERNTIWNIELINDTAWPHAMHLHGHHFEVEEEIGGNCLRDTMLIDAWGKKTIRLLADNPGKWLIHCHMLEHQFGGMVTWFNVS